MAKVSAFEDLEVWCLARHLYTKILVVTDRIKAKHAYRFAEQMSSSCGSIMDNIAEGFERNSRLEFVNSLSIAKGECGELKSQLYRCLDSNFITKEEFNELYEAADKLLHKLGSFIRYLNTSIVKGLKFKDRQ